MNHSLILKGCVPTKKNNLRRAKNGGMFIDSKVADAIAPLVLQAQSEWNGKPTLQRVTSIKAFFYVTSQRQDLDGMYTTTQDVLVKAGVVKNDNITVIRMVQMCAIKTAKGFERVELEISE